jgi:hypothetical protein
MVLTVYLDESGHDDKLLVMGGFASTSERWLEFSKECDLIKAHFDIPDIHAAELFNLKRTRHYGHLTLNRRTQAAGALVSAILDHAEFSLAVTVIPRVYDRLTTKQWRSKYGTVYSSCVSGILIGLTEFLDIPNGEALTLNIFLEDGHAHAGEAEEVIRDYKAFSDKSDVPALGGILDPPLRIGEYGRLTKEAAAPLWAADLISYCTYGQIVRRDAFCAEIMQTIQNRIPGFGVHLGDEQIQTMVQDTVLGENLQLEWKENIHQLVKYLFQFGITAHKDRRGVMLDLSAMTSEQKLLLLDNAKGECPEEP